MKVYAMCLKCKSDISFWTWESDRVGLKFTKGDSIELECKNCNSKEKYPVNEIKAKESKLAHIIALAIFLIGTPIVFIFFGNYIFRTLNFYSVIYAGSIFLVPSAIFMIISKNDRIRVRSFNRS